MHERRAKWVCEWWAGVAASGGGRVGAVGDAAQLQSAGNNQWDNHHQTGGGRWAVGCVWRRGERHGAH